jgi:hypothetical protein
MTRKLEDLFDLPSSVEIETELNEETESMTSYQAWKSYLESI